jgi:MOSC domain-containing protein YiiM
LPARGGAGKQGGLRDEEKRRHVRGRIEGIWVCGEGGEAMTSVPSAEAVRDRGLAGDRYLLGTGHWSGRGSDPLTLIEAEALESLDVEPPLTAGEARRNLVVRGARLEKLVGRRFRVGDSVVLEGVRPCEPCGYLETLTGRPGLKAALGGRGGLRATVVEGGTLQVGDLLATLLID